MLKKLLFAVVALSMVLGSFASALIVPTQASYRIEAADSAPTLNTMSGSGTQSNPYIIRNITDLQNINLHLSAYYELGNDIDASATVGWNGGAGFLPIGSVAPYFTGQLDGKGYRVDGLFQKTGDPVAPLYRIGTGGVVKNLGLTNVNINDGLDVAGFCLGNDGQITNCYSTGAVSGAVYPHSFAAGFCYEVTVTGKITNCYSTCAVSTGAYAIVSEAIGFCWEDDGTITNCYAAGAVSGETTEGFCLSLGGTIISCYWDTQTSGTSSSNGGTGKTTSEMKQRATFIGWDFTTPIWHIVNGISYPTLAYVPGPTPTPLILVHGWNSDSNEWTDMITYLENNGYKLNGPNANLFVINLSHCLYGKANCEITGYADELSNLIDEVKWETHSQKVDLVCHSMGGLAARWYTEYGYRNDVRNLVMIGTPNHGTPLAALGAAILGPLGIFAGGIAGAEMIPNSPFLNWLNYGNPLQLWGYDWTNPAIHHETIAGTGRYVWWKYLLTFPFLDRPNDGLIEEHSVKLDGVHNQEVPYNHTEEINADKSSQMVLDILQGNTAGFQQSSMLAEDEQDNSTAQQAPAISGKIFSGGQKSYGIPISATSNATFVLFWQSGDLDLTLTTPGGTVINSSVVIGDSNVTYYYDGNTTIEGYTVTNSESGIWQVNISAVDVPAEGENYSVMTGLETSINLSLNLAKYEYNPGEQISIVAELENGSSPLTGASVAAAIQRPTGSVDSLALYDDGLHGDGQAADGIYANAYANTATSGMYGIIVSANGTVNSKGFARQAVSTVWAEYYPDLTLASSDISFSNNAPVPGQNVTNHRLYQSMLMNHILLRQGYY